jgi:hypothetical protein
MRPENEENPRMRDGGSLNDQLQIGETCLSLRQWNPTRSKHLSKQKEAALMFNSLTCFEKFLPTRDQRFMDLHNQPWRWLPPIIRNKSGRTCAEIAKSLEEKAKKASLHSVIWSTKTRYEILKKAGFKCMACGAPANKKELHIDHIKPISKYPELKRDPNNLQVLCIACNISKSNKHEDDLRPDTPKSK